MTTCIGLTGGIATGKTTVSKIFAELGVDIIDTDHIAHDLLQQTTIQQQLQTQFGPQICNNGQIDRSKLRQLIFNNSDAKTWLEQLLHPLIRQQAEQLRRQSSATYCLLIVPLLYNRDNYQMDRICVTDCSRQTQIARACARDQMTEQQAITIIDQQPSAATRRQLADDIINTDCNIANLQQQVAELHQQYCAL